MFSSQDPEAGFEGSYGGKQKQANGVISMLEAFFALTSLRAATPVTFNQSKICFIFPVLRNGPQFADLWQVVRDDFEKSATSTEESEDKAADEFTKLKLQSKTDISGKTTQKKLNEEIQDGGGKGRSCVFFLFL